jgi:hypothetical protein
MWIRLLQYSITLQFITIRKAYLTSTVAADKMTSSSCKNRTLGLQAKVGALVWRGKGVEKTTDKPVMYVILLRHTQLTCHL